MLKKQYYYLDDAAKFITDKTGHSISPDDLVDQAIEKKLYLHVSASNWMIKYPYKQAFLFNGYCGIEPSCLKTAIQTFKKCEEFFLTNINVTSDELAKICIVDNSGYIHLLPETATSCHMAITDIVVKREYLLEFIELYCQSELKEKDEQECITEQLPTDIISNVFRQNRTGTWIIEFDGQVFPALPHRIGFSFIQHLLKNPGKSISAKELSSLSSKNIEITETETINALLSEGLSIIDSSNAGQCIDSLAMKAYKSRIDELKDLIEDAREFDNIDSIENYEYEYDAILSELRRSTNLNGIPKIDKSDNRRVSQTVSKSIKNAINEIIKQSPGLAKYLTNYISTGNKCEYKPPAHADWSF